MSTHPHRYIRHALAAIVMTAAVIFGSASSAAAAPVVTTSPFQVTLSASPSRLAFFGDTTTLTYRITNTSRQPATITTLTADGTTVTGSASCKVGTTLARGRSCSFTRTLMLSANYSPVPFSLTVGGQQRNVAVPSATGSVNITFVMATPAVGVTATAASAIPASGGATTVTVTLTNRTGAPATINRWQDDLTGPGYGSGACALGATLAAGASCSFQTSVYASGPAGSTYPISYYAVVTSAGTLYVGQSTLALTFV